MDINILEPWAWAWAGENNQNVIVSNWQREPTIFFLHDLSGNGHDFLIDGRDQYSGGRPPTSLANGVTLGDWSTTLPMIGGDRWESGRNAFGSVFYQDEKLRAQDFFLVVVWNNTRINGVRNLWGTDPNHCMWVNQQTDLLTIKIGEEQVDLGHIPKGPQVLCVWRRDGSLVEASANMSPITSNPKPMVEQQMVSGFGWDQIGNRYFDDYLCELVMFNRMLNPVQIIQLIGNLMTKWSIRM